MKALTENQQNIINAMTTEFNRINNLSAPKSNFNLVDAISLMSINDEIKRNNEEADAIKRHWEQLAKEEAERIVSLLRQDLPMLVIERWGKSNGRVDHPSVIIQKGVGLMLHGMFVSFDVKIVYGDYVRQSHGCGYQNPIGLKYGYRGRYDKTEDYDSVEDLFKNSTINDDIRTNILS